MSEKIECPECHYMFTPEIDEEGLCECPNCGVGLMAIALPLDLGLHEQVMDFEECVEETWYVKQDLLDMDDTSLEDEIAEEIALKPYMKNTFNILTEMDTHGYMSYDMRKMAEGVYILKNTKKMWGYEH